ncbi:MAG: helix-turn-helix domain-containing protein [Pseudomonadota bacterium]
MLPIGVSNEVEQLACPIRNVVAKVTGKWQVLILLALEDGALRFGVLRRTIGDVTQGVLTENLRGLERDGLLTRQVHAGPPLAVSYELTERGAGLVTMLKPLVLWAGENITSIKADRAAYDAHHP